MDGLYLCMGACNFQGLNVLLSEYIANCVLLSVHNIYLWLFGLHIMVCINYQRMHLSPGHVQPQFVEWHIIPATTNTFYLSLYILHLPLAHTTFGDV